MKFTEFEPYLHQILALEFGDRDHEIQINSTRLKEEMNARGMLHSTITLGNVADFLLAEFKARCGLVAEHVVGKLAVLKPADGSDKTSHGVPIFHSVATDQLAHIEKTYDSIAGPISVPLQSDMPAQIRQHLMQRMNDHRKKVELTVELECKAADSMGTKEVFALRPTFYGVGIDLKELWKKFFPE